MGYVQKSIIIWLSIKMNDMNNKFKRITKRSIHRLLNKGSINPPNMTNKKKTNWKSIRLAFIHNVLLVPSLIHHYWFKKNCAQFECHESKECV